MAIYLKLIATMIIWGGTFITGRILAEGVSPYVAAFLRFFIASLFLVLLTLRKEGKLPAIPRSQVLPVTLLGLSGVFCYNIFFFKGLAHIPAARASLIIANNPVFITLFAALLFKERLSRRALCGVLLSLIGAMVVITDGQLTQLMDLKLGAGELSIFVCVASWVCYSLIGKGVMRHVSPSASVCYSSLIGTLFLFPLAISHGLFETTYTPLHLVSLFYMGFFGTVLGFFWYYEGIMALGPTRAGIFINIVPVSATLLAWLILGEPVGLSTCAGALFVITGVTLTNRAR
jgi:drug/metabolite transporter (DMT)-like permease